MTVFAEINNHTVVVVHAKCGSTTFNKLCDERGWRNISLKEIQSCNHERVYCVLKHPIHRLFSTFRMFYIRPAVAWTNGWHPWGEWHYHRLPCTTLYARRNVKMMMKDPIRAWRQWLNSDHFRELIGPLREIHTKGYAGLYNSVLRHCPQATCHTNLTVLMQELGLPPRHEHVGLWPWPARTIDDFVKAAGRVPHLDADFELWNAYK